jgi:hypothetical protein
MQAVARRLSDQFGARAQPYPFAAAVANAKCMVDGVRLGGGETSGDFAEIPVGRMHQRIDVAERDVAALIGQTEDLEHRARPVDASARQVPVPQAAAAATERGVHSLPHAFANRVRFPGPRFLPEIGPGDQADRAGRSEQQNKGAERGDAPAIERAGDGIDCGDLAERWPQRPHGGQRVEPRRQRQTHDSGLLGEGGQRLRVAENVGQGAPLALVGRQRRDDEPVLVRDENAPSVGQDMRRKRRLDLVRRCKRLRLALEVEAVADRLRDQLQLGLGVGERRRALLDLIEDGDSGENRQNGADDKGQRPTKPRFVTEDASVRRIDQRTRQVLQCSRMRESAGRVDARHRLAPSYETATGSQCAASLPNQAQLNLLGRLCPDLNES